MTKLIEYLSTFHVIISLIWSIPSFTLMLVHYLLKISIPDFLLSSDYWLAIVGFTNLRPERFFKKSTERKLDKATIIITILSLSLATSIIFYGTYSILLGNHTLFIYLCIIFGIALLHQELKFSLERGGKK